MYTLRPTSRRVLFALAALTAFVSGCNKPADGKKDGAASGAAPEAGAIKIGFLVKQPESTWFQYDLVRKVGGIFRAPVGRASPRRQRPDAWPGRARRP
jgi:hypothetical protein